MYILGAIGLGAALGGAAGAVAGAWGIPVAVFFSIPLGFVAGGLQYSRWDRTGRWF